MTPNDTESPVIFAWRGFLLLMRDRTHGSEFTAGAVRAWLSRIGVKTLYIEPGSPWEIRILTIVDAFSKLSPAIDVRQQYRGRDVVDTLERVTSIYGLPKSIRVDQGPEFISKDLDRLRHKISDTPEPRRGAINLNH